MELATTNAVRNCTPAGDLQPDNCHSVKVVTPDDTNALTEEGSCKLRKGTTEASIKYAVDDKPSWPISILLGFQHYLTMVGATFTIPYILCAHMCVAPNDVVRSELLGTIFFVSGIVTFLQAMFGIRLPIIQGGTFAFLLPTLTILSLPQWKCPESSPEPLLNDTASASFLYSNTSTTVYPDAIATEKAWQPRIREIQGAIIVASLFEVVIGATGVVGYIQRFIGPLVITPVISLIGLALFKDAANYASTHWAMALLTMAMIALFAEYSAWFDTSENRSTFVYMRRVLRGIGVVSRVCRIFPIILSIIAAWLICLVLTMTNFFPDDPLDRRYMARTDVNIDILKQAPWFRVPYPFQWGIPTVSVAGVCGILAGVMASIVESVGDYYSCARFAGAAAPPSHALNRGIFIEGIGCILAGIWGTGNGTTSYSENISVIGITKVGSRRVILSGAVIMIICGIFTKFCALFVSLPHPIIGGLFIILFGLITAVGISNLQFVDLNSTRNLFVIGVSIFFGLTFPTWLKGNSHFINTGSAVFDQVLLVLLSTSMFVGGALAMILDNTIPGTPQERGLIRWENALTSTSRDFTDEERRLTYDLPFGMAAIRRINCLKHLPISPTYTNRLESICLCKRSKVDSINNN